MIHPKLQPRTVVERSGETVEDPGLVRRRRSNRPGNSQAKGPMGAVNSEELPSFVTRHTAGANDCRTTSWCDGS
eukprot:gene607-610_t